MGTLLGIATKRAKRAEMQLLESAFISRSGGVTHDFRGKPGKRQVTVLNQQAWIDACREINKELVWTERRANLLVSDINLYQSTGKIIKIGEVELLVTGETDPCSRMDEVYDGLHDSLLKDWRGGVCCRVISEGELHINDKVELIES